MENNKPEDIDVSVAMNRLDDEDNAGGGVVKKGLNVKALLAIAGIAAAGGGFTYATHKSKQNTPAHAAADSTALMQGARAQAAGYDPNKDTPFDPASAQRVGVPGDTNAGAEERMKALQEQARMPGNGNSPASVGSQQQAPSARPAPAPQSVRSMGGGGGMAAAIASILPPDLRMRLQPEYQQWLEHQSSPAVAWSRAEAASVAASVTGPVSQIAAGGVPGVDPSLQNLYAGGGVAAPQNFYMPASSEMTCVTDHPINTDYPGAIRATVISPIELKGAKMIVNYSGVNLERANATVGTLVLNRGGTWNQYSVQGQIRTDLPALNGIVNHHYARRIIPTVANAGIAGGALVMSGNSSNNNISTQDQIYNSMMVAGLNGVQTEIGKINEGKPEVTVVVPAGQEFNVLLTAGLEIK